MIKKIFKFISLFFLLLLMTVIVVLKSMNFRWSDEKFKKNFEKEGSDPIIRTISISGNQIRYIQTGNIEKQPIVFLHGSPGSSRDFKEYLLDKSLQAKALMRAVDRPGYGGSNYGMPVISIKKQAEIVSNAIEPNSVVVGHSLGGPVAAALAMYYPEKVKELVLLAPAVDPYHEKQFMNHIIGKPPLKYLFSKGIQVTFEEKLAHENALMDIMNGWGSIECPVTIIHGKNDWIVPYENVAFLKEKLVNAPVEFITPEDMDHMMIWSNYELVKALFLKQL